VRFEQWAKRTNGMPPSCDFRSFSREWKPMTQEQIDTLAQYFANLYDRWQDEKQYEDFADYRKALEAAVEKRGGAVKTFTSRPFRADVFSGDTRFVFKADARKVTVHSVEKAVRQ
jgi:hypothetical protein